jgi:hypothetical protein
VISEKLAVIVVDVAYFFKMKYKFALLFCVMRLAIVRVNCFSLVWTKLANQHIGKSNTAHTPNCALSSSNIRCRSSSSSSSHGIDISIDKRTVECLDFSYVLESLKNSTVTKLGAEISGERFATDSATANMYYAMVDEIQTSIGFMPLRTSMNVWPVLKAVEMNSSPPEKEDLAYFAEHIESIIELHEFFVVNSNKLTLFSDLVTQMILPDELISGFKGKCVMNSILLLLKSEHS